MPAEDELFSAVDALLEQVAQDDLPAPAERKRLREAAGRTRPGSPALPAQYAARLFDAQEQGAAEQQLLDNAAEGLQEIYFKDRGRRAQGPLVEFTDIDYIEVDL